MASDKIFFLCDCIFDPNNLYSRLIFLENESFPKNAVIYLIY